MPSGIPTTSFAFIDFNSPKEATYALAVRANRFFRGSRKLNLQVSREATIDMIRQLVY